MDEEARMPELDDDYRQRLDKQPLWHTYPILYEQASPFVSMPILSAFVMGASDALRIPLR